MNPSSRLHYSSSDRKYACGSKIRGSMELSTRIMKRFTGEMNEKIHSRDVAWHYKTNFASPLDFRLSHRLFRLQPRNGGGVKRETDIDWGRWRENVIISCIILRIIKINEFADVGWYLNYSYVGIPIIRNNLRNLTISCTLEIGISRRLISPKSRPTFRSPFYETEIYLMIGSGATTSSQNKCWNWEMKAYLFLQQRNGAAWFIKENIFQGERNARVANCKWLFIVALPYSQPMANPRGNPKRNNS